MKLSMRPIVYVKRKLELLAKKLEWRLMKSLFRLSDEVVLLRSIDGANKGDKGFIAKFEYPNTMKVYLLNGRKSGDFVVVEAKDVERYS